jgi:HipA-like protein
MARPRTRIPLNIFLNGRVVGSLRRQASGAIDFEYDSAWLAWEHALPVSLSLPLREDRYVGDPVIAVLDNLLPDNEQIRRRLAERVRAEGYDAYSLLAAVGRDCVGALQFLPARSRRTSGVETLTGRRCGCRSSRRFFGSSTMLGGRWLRDRTRHPAPAARADHRTPRSLQPSPVSSQVRPAETMRPAPSMRSRRRNARDLDPTESGGPPRTPCAESGRPGFGSR